jgi:hypothetical protein
MLHPVYAIFHPLATHALEFSALAGDSAMSMQGGQQAMDEAQRPPRHAVVMIDIDREREHWRQRYHGLPRARAMRSFARYWPVLGAAYDVYLNHPRAAREEALRLYLQRDDVMASVLTEDEAGTVFERAWSRIRDSEGATDWT